jgi:uncharacterized membrane protein
LIGLVAALAVATVVGLVLLWPHAEPHRVSSALGGPTVAAKVVRSVLVPCVGPGKQTCRQLTIAVGGGQHRLTLGPVEVTPDVPSGAAIRVRHVDLPRGTTTPPGFEAWTFAGVDRRGSLLWLGIALAAFALVAIRLRGVLAAIGVGLSLLILLTFVVPAILQGRPPLLVALVGACAVMFVTLILTNGFGAQTLAAAAGIGATLALTAVVGSLAVHAAHLDGQGTEIAAYLSQQRHGLSLEGIVLAGMVIGALGVLADTAVTQASAVMALRRASPGLSSRGLYREAFVVGRDHLSATIHTLVLAYAGATLPLLLAVRSSGVSTTDALNLQDLAEPITATLVGCIGLIAAVPLTTGLAAILVSRIPPRALPEGGHAHHH